MTNFRGPFPFTVLLVATMASLASGQGAHLVDSRSLVAWPPGTCADVVVQGDLAYVARRGEGIAIVNIADPAAPVTLWSGRPELFVQDVKIRGTLLACSNESGNGRAVYLFDVSNPAAPVELGSYGSFSMMTCNNSAFLGNLLYCISTTINQVVILDVSNPAIPVMAGMMMPMAMMSMLHDLAIVGTRLHLSLMHGGFEIHELSPDPLMPMLVAWHMPAGVMIHNTLPHPDGIHVVTTDEAAGGHLMVWDVSSPANVALVGQWRASPTATMHNLEIREHLAFVTNYTEGLRVVDLQAPAAPAEIAWFDTYAGAGPGLYGAWGLSAADRDRICVADFSSGLHVLDLRPMDADLAADQTVYGWGQTIGLTLGATSLTAATLPLFAGLSFSVAELGPGSIPLFAAVFPMPGLLATGPVPYPIPLPASGPPGPFTTTFTLTLASAGSSVLYDAATATVVIN